MFMKVQVSSIWKKKIFVMIGSRIRTPRPEVQVHRADHYTTKDLLEDREII